MTALVHGACLLFHYRVTSLKHGLSYFYMMQSYFCVQSLLVLLYKWRLLFKKKVLKMFLYIINYNSGKYISLLFLNLFFTFCNPILFNNVFFFTYPPFIFTLLFVCQSLFSFLFYLLNSTWTLFLPLVVLLLLLLVFLLLQGGHFK